ncbi:SMC family ATPase [Streptococcus anginosus]|nr:SMC family ATPase [Streptococcus anginosus]ATF56508.1 exonuclease [Streptococcus oralis]MCW0924346.1 SMC family ATPase [Streptococcus anginosus]
MMIRLKQVIIKNFRNFQGTHQFDFSKDVTIFLGDNGNGKSSVFDAIQWCLTGNVERFKNVSSADIMKSVLINKNSDECAVEIIFTTNLSLKRVAPRYGNIRVSCNYGNEIVRGDKNVKEYIEGLFKNSKGEKFDIQEFLKSSLLAQDQVLDFISSDTANDRYRVLSSILGMNEITNLKENYEKVRSLLDNEMEKKADFVKSLQKEIDLQESKIDYGYKYLITDEISNSSFEDKQKENNELQKSKAQIEERLTRFNLQYNNIKQDIGDLNQIANTIKSLEYEIKELQIDQEKNLKDSALNDNLLEQNKKNIEQANKEEEFLSKNKLYQSEFIDIKNKLSNSNFDGLTFETDKDIQKKIEDLKGQVEKYQYALSHIVNYYNLINDKEQIPKSIDEFNKKNEKLEGEIQVLQDRVVELKSDFSTVESKNDIDSLIQLVQEAYKFVSDHKEFENTCPVCSQSVKNTPKHFDERITNLLEQSNITAEKISGFRKRINEIESSILNKQEEVRTIQLDISKLKYQENEIQTKLDIILGDYLYVKDNFTLDKEQLEYFINESQNTIEKCKKYLELKNKKSIIEDQLAETSDIEFSGLNLKELLSKNEELLKQQDKLLILQNDQKNYLEEKNRLLNLLNNVSEMIDEYAKEYSISNYNDIPNVLSNLIDDKNNKIISLAQELKKHQDIIIYNALNENIRQKKKSLQQPKKTITALKEKLEIVDEEIKKINESYNFVQLINSNESIIQQYFNYLNPNVSSYRNLYFNINDDDNTLDIEIKNSDGTTNVANVLSSGQLNVLAIAIFIAKNISQNSTVIDFIGIDDPIQNMDDINQFSMIDVLSQLKKQLIFTTHDVKYVNLFLKKNELRLDDISVYYLDAENDRYENILI